MNNVIMRLITLDGGDYRPLSTVSLVGTFTISCPPANTASVRFKGDDGSDVPWIAGEWHEFKCVDLSGIQVKGAAGDTVSVVGGTW
ncbi:MAG: hypothetical protein NT049_08755 [Planctomycetota bacterium]|nr:hypothetical protein [Planctomycetota bacterium]